MLTYEQIQKELKSIDLELRREILRDSRLTELIRLQNAKIHLLQTMVELLFEQINGGEK